MYVYVYLLKCMSVPGMYVPGMYVCMVVTYSKSKDQSGEVADPARGQLNMEN